MKKTFTILALVTLVWGCAKKVTPTQSETPATNTGSVIGQTKPVETDPGKATTATTAQAPIENTGATGTKVAPTGTNNPETNAAIAGQATYNAKCGKCHGLKVTTDYTADRWSSILAVMAQYAKLTDTEKDNVYAYVKANAKKG
jgi:mono/diheme cytochrome c family protein